MEGFKLFLLIIVTVLFSLSLIFELVLDYRRIKSMIRKE